MAFSEVREYQLGDEIRSIDWNVTARFNSPFVKVFEEEREMTVMLLVDMSASKGFGSKKQLKEDLVTELCAVLSFSAIQNNDKVGVLFFSDQVEKFIPPKKGKSHILMIIRELLEFQPEHKGTDIGGALKYFNSAIKKRCTAFIISDFLDHGFEDNLKIANRRHDVVALQIFDEREAEMPSVGFVQVEDAESGKRVWLNTWSKKTRNSYKAKALAQQANIKDIMRRSGVDHTRLTTHQSYIQPLMSLFKRRGSR